METPEKLAFYVSWASWGSGDLKELVMVCYPQDHSVELRYAAGGGVHLKRVEVNKKLFKSLYVGAQLVLFSRHLRILDAANEQTAAYLALATEPVLCVCRTAELTSFAAGVLQQLLDKGLVLASCRLLTLATPLAAFLESAAPGIRLEGDSAVEAASAVAYFLLRGEGATKEVADAAGRGPPLAYKGAPPAVSSFAVEDLTRRLTAAADECAAESAAASEVTCCVIKPHALQQTGAILAALASSGLRIACMQSFRLTPPTASEFLAVYDGMLDEMTDGTVVALQLEGPDAVARLRRLAGPYDPEVGRLLHATSLRARLGEDAARNAIHCTDLPEDGALECAYFFKLLQQPLQPPAASAPRGVQTAAAPPQHDLLEKHSPRQTLCPVAVGGNPSSNRF
ncbi:hypothetical protein Efla_001923 [Eimeria flavescens]